MEIILVYSLLPLFFVILFLFIVLSFLRENTLSKADPLQSDDVHQERSTTDDAHQGKKTTYLSVVVFFVLLMLLVFLQEYDYGRKDGT